MGRATCYQCVKETEPPTECAKFFSRNLKIYTLYTKLTKCFLNIAFLRKRCKAGGRDNSLACGVPPFPNISVDYALSTQIFKHVSWFQSINLELRGSPSLCVKALVLVVERGYRYRSTPNSEFLCKRYWSTQSRDISNGLFTRSSAVAGFVAYSRPARDILWLPEHHE